MAGLLFKNMSEFTFRPEYETRVFINGTDGITVEQNQEGESQYVMISSKARAIEIAGAIRDLAKRANFSGGDDE